MLKGESNYILKRDGTEGETKIVDQGPNPTSMGADLRYMHAYRIPPGCGALLSSLNYTVCVSDHELRAGLVAH